MIKKLKQTKGVTLMALIITIVILLILSVIAIRKVNGDGMISKVRESMNKYNDASDKEKIKLALNDYNMLKENAPKSFIEYLTNVDTHPDWCGNVQQDNDGTVTVEMKESRKQYKIDKNGDINELKTLLNYGLNDENIGDYINYDCTIDADGNSLIGDSKLTLNGITVETNPIWKILGIENGNILITTSSPTVSALTIYSGSNGCKAAIDKLNSTANIYGHGKYAVQARSINVDDVNLLSGYDPSTYTGTKVIYRKLSSKVEYSKDGGNTWYTSSYSTFLMLDEISNEWISLKPDGFNQIEIESTSYRYSLPYTSNDKIKKVMVEDGSSKISNCWLASRYMSNASAEVYYGVRYIYRKRY